MRKINRTAVYQKYNGHCAYCGNPMLIKDMQIDHYWPRVLAHMQNLDNDRFENLMPSCRKCNNFKTGMRPEVFREELQMQVCRLMKNAQFERALRFGQVSIHETPIKFYYEKQEETK